MDDSRLAFDIPLTGRRKVVCSFDGGEMTSDAGFVLISEADRRLGLTQALAGEVEDSRQQAKVKHVTHDIVRERVYSIAMGYEDANDLSTLRDDPALKVACHKRPLEDEALASQPTISRFENSIGRKRLLGMGKRMARMVVGQLPADTKQVILDIDATDDPCHGQQELRLFDGHLGTYCYLPLYMHITDETGRQRLMGTLLRSACGRSTKGVMSMVRLAVRIVRERFPDARIVLRGDCGFGYGRLMNWCDAHGVDYVFAFQVTDLLKDMALPVQMDVAIKHSWAGEGCREYGDVSYCGKTWDRSRRIVIKAEAKGGVIDTRYVVTSDTDLTAEDVYIWYTQRGDLENRIKEMKLDLSSGRTSCHRFLANQFRLMLHTAACVLVGVLQAGLSGTRWSKAQVGTVRLRLLKVGARVVESCRTVWLHLPASFPDKDIWSHLRRAVCAGVT